MFEAAEVGNALSEAEYDRQTPALRVALIDAQYDLSTADFPVVVVLAGDDRVGCNETLNRLHEWMDARYLQTSALRAPSDEELERPRFWRFWRRLPSRGQLGIYFGAWAQQAVADRVRRAIGEREFARRLEHMTLFERTLVADGALVLEFWLHLNRTTQLERFRAREQTPYKKYKITAEDYRNRERWRDDEAAVHEMVVRTSTKEAPWTLVPANDKRFARVEVVRTVCRGLRQALEAR